MTISLDLPEDVVRHLTAQGEDLAQTAIEAIALEGYRSGKLTQSQVRRLLGYETRMEVDGFLKRHGFSLEYTEDDWEREAAISQRLREQREREMNTHDRDHRRAG